MAVASGAVVISGASTGIGWACALHLDRRGYRVFAGVRRQEDAERLRGEASARLSPLMLDVTDEQQVRRAAEEVAEATRDGELVGLVNNAGIAVAAPLEHVALEDLRRQFEVNVVAPVAMTQAFLPLLRRRPGRVVNMSSITGRLAPPFLGPYAASKHALEALSDALRVELRPWGVRVIVVEPGAIATPIWQKGIDESHDLEREMGPEGVAPYRGAFEAMRTLASDASREGLPAERVAEAVEHALVSARPKTRYLVGRDARVLAVMRRVPDGLRDRLIMRQLGLS